MSQVIDHSSKVPLYSQIKQILIDEIQSGAGQGMPVLTEDALMKRFHVSRTPIRQALKELADDGFVIRRRAKGTFPVQGQSVRLPPALELGGLTRYLTEQGLEPTSRVTHVERIVAPDEVSLALGLRKTDEVLHVRRLITVKGQPLVWAQTYLCTPPEFRTDAAELEKVGTVFVLIQKQLGITFTRGEQQIWASGANADEARALGVKPGTPVLIAVTSMFTREGRPGGWRRAVHRADDFKYVFGV